MLHSASVISKGKRILTKDLPNTVLEQIEKSSPTPPSDNSHSLKEVQPSSSVLTDKGETLKDSNTAPVASFGQSSKNPSDLTAPSSISANEAYDIAYANAREKTDINLLEIVEKEMIQRALKENGGNQVKASAMLGITRATLRKRIDTHSIRY